MRTNFFSHLLLFLCKNYYNETVKEINWHFKSSRKVVSWYVPGNFFLFISWGDIIWWTSHAHVYSNDYAESKPHSYHMPSWGLAQNNWKQKKHQIGFYFNSVCTFNDHFYNKIYTYFSQCKNSVLKRVTSFIRNHMITSH